MDPYLEAHWADVHASLITFARGALNRVLPDDLAARTEERVAVESNEDGAMREQHYSPEVRLIEVTPGGVALAETIVAEVSASQPIRLIAQMEPVRERSIRIIDAGTQRIITVIEFLSPSNKHGPGLAEFRSKRAELLTAGVNFIEVDFVRQGSWQSVLRPHICPPNRLSTYRVTVRTPQEPAVVLLYPIWLRQALPSIVVPLRPGDPRVELELQPLLDQVYTEGRYARSIDYKRPPTPPLVPADQAWVEELVAGR